MGDNGLLAALGVGPAEEMMYRSLLQHPNTTLTELTRVSGWQVSKVRRHLRALEQLGMLTRSSDRPVRYAPAAPDFAAEVLVLQRQVEIERARMDAARLADEFRAAFGHNCAGTVIRDCEAIAQRVLHAQQAARREVLIVDPPLVAGPGERQQQIQQEQMLRGITYRVIYDQSSLDTADRLTAARELAMHGAQVRMLVEVPLKLVITDRSMCLAPFGCPPEQEVLVLNQSALLNGLIALFDALWDNATPLWHAGAVQPPTGLTAQDEMLLVLAATGLTDEAIARRLGVGQRTVERRWQRVMNLLGVQTRYQAGLQAALLGIAG
ncbi:MAG TPA: transcriptional regulator TrmB [Micromonosporaceae bacterium]|nr:transcriptional regulator TrmB [Micromonosporaceae bacterium]